MKNVQVIDSAENCTYDVFAISDFGYLLMFPDGRDIEFIDDFIKRVGKRRAKQILDPMWKKRKNKLKIVGLHGTLFFELSQKKPFYPTKISEEMIAVL